LEGVLFTMEGGFSFTIGGGGGGGEGGEARMSFLGGRTGGIREGS